MKPDARTDWRSEHTKETLRNSRHFVDYLMAKRSGCTMVRQEKKPMEKKNSIDFQGNIELGVDRPMIDLGNWN